MNDTTTTPQAPVTTSPKSEGFGTVQSYRDNAENAPFDLSAQITLSPVPESPLLGLENGGAVSVTLHRIAKGVFFAELPPNAQGVIHQSPALGTVRGAVSAVLKAAKLDLKHYLQPDWKAETAALFPAPAKPAKVAAEGDNEAFFFEADGEGKARLDALTAALEGAEGDIEQGTARTLEGWHGMAVTYTAIKALFADCEGDRSTRAFGKWITAVLNDRAPKIAEKLSSKNAASKLAAMAVFPLDVCQRLNASTPSMVEKVTGEIRRSYVALVAEILVPVLGNPLPEGVNALERLQAKLNSDHEHFTAQRTAHKDRAAKHMEAGNISEVTKEMKLAADCDGKLLAVTVMDILIESAARAETISAAILAAAEVRAKAVEQAAKDEGEQDRAAESRVSKGFDNLSPDQIAARLFAMIQGREDASDIVECLLDLVENDTAPDGTEGEGAEG